MESNLQLPYNLHAEDEWNYSFTTKHGIKYHAYFIDISSYHPHFDEVYTFNIEPESNEPHHIDNRIAVTVIDILTRFFSEKQRAMLMVCDNLDGKEQKRELLFSRWFSKYNDGTLLKFNASVDTEDYTLFVSIFLRKDHPDGQGIVKAFYELVTNEMYPI